jgi:hypothetical protein
MGADYDLPPSVLQLARLKQNLKADLAKLP